MSKALGDILREARERKGLTVEQLAAITKLNIAFIEALESGRRDLLPGNIYLKPFTKTCAEALGLNTKELYGIIDGEIWSENNKVGNFELADPPRKSRYKLPVVLGLAVIIIAVIVVSVKLKDSIKNGDTPEIVVPAETEIRIRDKKWSRPWESPAEVKMVIEEKTETKPVVPVIRNQRRGRLVLRADDSVYVRIIADGDMIYDSYLRANEKKTFSAKNSMTISLNRNDCITGYLDGIKVNELGIYPEKIDNLVLFTGKDY